VDGAQDACAGEGRGNVVLQEGIVNSSEVLHIGSLRQQRRHEPRVLLRPLGAQPPNDLAPQLLLRLAVGERP
jgi:hypothetical protein